MKAMQAQFLVVASADSAGLNFPDSATAEKVARGVQRYILRQWRKANDLDKKEKPEGQFLSFNICAQPVDDEGDAVGDAFILTTIK